MARTDRCNQLEDDPFFDRHSIELSLRSSQISRPDHARVKRRFQDVLDRRYGNRGAQSLPAIASGSLADSQPVSAVPSTRSPPSEPPAQDRFSHSQQTGDTERTPLLNVTTGRPLYQNESPWIRYPSLYLHLIWIILASNYANALLLFIPLAYTARALHWPAEAVLVLNSLPILPLSLLIALGAEELSVKIGSSFANVMAFSFGNAGTVIIGGVLLQRGEILVVQTSLLGAIVFNLLVVVGLQYIASGLTRAESTLGATAVQVQGSALLVSVANIALPAVLRQVQDEVNVIRVSRILAVMLITLYLLMLAFQLHTHSRLFEEEEHVGWDDSSEDDDEPRFLGPTAAITLLAVATAALTANTQFFVDTLAEVTDHHDISRTFIGFIFLPFVSNAVSHFTEVGDAYRNKMYKATSVAIGCSLQIALFLLPATVLVGWAIGQPMTLHFDVFLNASAFIAVLLVNAVTSNGKSNYFEGLLLLNCYVGIAAGAFYYSAGPGDGN